MGTEVENQNRQLDRINLKVHFFTIFQIQEMKLFVNPDPIFNEFLQIILLLEFFFHE